MWKMWINKKSVFPIQNILTPTRSPDLKLRLTNPSAAEKSVETYENNFGNQKDLRAKAKFHV
jgi:hypothetical protein